MRKIAKSKALALFKPGATVRVKRMWNRVSEYVWREVDFPMRMAADRTVERVRSRDVIAGGSHIDVMDADLVLRDDTRLKIVWANMAIEYELGGE